MNNDRDILIKRLEKQLGDKDKQLKEVQSSLDRFLIEKEKETTMLDELNKRFTALEKKVAEINSSYDGLMRELLDQKSVIQTIIKESTAQEQQSVETQNKEREEDDIIIASDLPAPNKKESVKANEVGEIIEI
ncbi:MAG: hypothetical protein DNFNHJIP_00385 [Candidatus Argoarchaeum ethanivorans]|uniref:Uncharacterized protein n=1 Tax=Candidatus Argoarchaeum ethanivorans TaxID=2608793 RepID=A0A812A1T5_9EURY|nr:MAG: hypothetical protein DNFNHJIP_00385 [Candidatus Argoarchaeum ethanivorans]